MKFLFCVVLLVGAAVKAQQDQDYVFPDYWQDDDYDNLYNYNDVDNSNENTDLKEIESSKQVDSEIQNIKEEIDQPNEPEDKKDIMEDYQIEDNRSNSNEKEPVQKKTEVNAEEPVPDDAPENEEDMDVAPLEDAQKQIDSEIQNIQEEIDDQNKLEDKKDVMEVEDNWSNSNEKQSVEINEEEKAEEPVPNNAPENKEDINVERIEDVQKDQTLTLPVPSIQDKNILQETKDILDEDKKGFEDEKSVPVASPEALDDIAQIIEETQRLLKETDDAFEANDEINSEKEEPDNSEKNLSSEDNDVSNDQIQDESENMDAYKQEQENNAEDTSQELLDGFDEAEKQEQSKSDEDPINDDYDENFKPHYQDEDGPQELFDGFVAPEEQDKSEEDIFSEDNDEIEEDTPKKVFDDLNADLDKLFETLNKLSEDNSDEEEDEVDDDAHDNVLDYEEKFNKPFNEDAVLAWRNAEAEDAEEDPNKSDENNVEELVEDNENYNKSAEDIDASDELESDEYEVIDDSNLSEIFKEHSEDEELKKKETNKENISNASNNDDQELELADVNVAEADIIKEEVPVDHNDAQEILDYVGNEESDNEPNADDDIDSVIKQIFSDDIKESQPYGNDGLVDENQPKNEDAEQIEITTKIKENAKQKSVMVDDLSSAELSDLMSQFAAAHEEEFRVNTDGFKRDSEPIHVTINLDTPTVITSPNYPDVYPTNQTIDWIIEGPGNGIEMNITNFAVNGAFGDYLLVKPGGIDESGTDGLIFSYRLNNERRYRFADVNRMFVRFESKEGLPSFTGFSFSVKLMWPLQDRPDEDPEPEPVITPPRYTITLNLAGLTLPQFIVIKEKFMVLVAEMASAYIRDHGIEFGSAPPLECLQITKTAVCNIHWPDYDTCVEVTFGIPLQYEDYPELEHRFNEEDLNNMWTNYTQEEIFASRLRELGITEYMIPDDRSILTVWLVIAGGVVISMAMLAFALWRFSCFEDYTRMRAYSDTDSIKNEKRNLDLYPTPHQTLPPLYSESDYKWADEKYDDSTRVDMGGFANKSYVRDDLFEYESDEDVITTRDRNGVVSPRDIYEV